MYHWLVALLRSMNLRAVYVFMGVLVVPWFVLLARGSRPTWRYYRVRRGYGWWQSLRSLYGNYYMFGQTVVDKFAMYAGRHFEIVYHGFEHARDRSADAPSLLLLNAHIGCNEILGYSFRFDKRCNVLVYGGEKAALMAYRKLSFGEMNIRMVPIGTDVSHSDEIVSALECGEYISVFADRFMTSSKVITSQLHGGTVYLARGPFAMAVTRGLEVYMVCTMKEDDGSYSAYLNPLFYDKRLTKAEQRQMLADAYTAELEAMMERYPLQWFNYSDIWREK